MLKIVHISGQTQAKPKKLTAKQREAKELELFMESMTRKRRIAAERMTDQLKASLK